MSLAVASARTLGFPVSAADGFVIGVSKTVQGNGRRAQMVCSIKAQALVSGKVASLNISHRNTDGAGQLEDIRNQISAGVDAIIVNPADPSAVNSAIKEATEAGMVVVAVDQTVSEPSDHVIRKFPLYGLCSRRTHSAIFRFSLGKNPHRATLTPSCNQLDRGSGSEFCRFRGVGQRVPAATGVMIQLMTRQISASGQAACCRLKQRAAAQWLWTYNNDRPNMGIGGITPAQKLKMAA
jgi:hypothetical protein